MLFRMCAPCALAAASLLFLASSQAQTAKPPVEAFGTLPAVSSPALSPDGKRIALIQVYNGHPVATIWTIEPKDPNPVILPYKDGFIDDVRWANNERLLVRINLNARMLGDSVKPWHRTISVDVNGQNPVVMFSNLKKARNYNYSSSRIADIAPDDPDHIYMPLFMETIDGRARFSLYRVNVTNGVAYLVTRGGSDTYDWIMDGKGNPIARMDQSERPLVDHLLVLENGEDWKEVKTADASGGYGLSIVGPTLDGSALVYSAASDRTGTLGFVTLSLADYSTKELFFNVQYDVTGPLIDPWTGHVVGISYIEDLERDYYFDRDLQTLQSKLETHLRNAEVHIVSWDRARQKVIVAVTGPRAPMAYYVFNAQTNSLSRLARSYSDLQSSDLGEVKPYPYKARDGIDIHAYLTLPPGKAPKNLPVVILPHGGPMARDSMSFDWQRQFLTNRGYAVLQPNFRGSSGYGVKFMEAGFGQWGLKMQDDVTDGVKKLIADGIADPKRICIVGGSYGGYAALAGATFTPDLYACAASWAGVFDLRHFLSSRSRDYGRDSAVISSWSRFIGDRWDDSEKLDAASPAKNAEDIKCPVLLVHGKDDSTVHIDQSEIMERALRRAGKNVTFIEIPKETHYMQTSASRIRWLGALEKFLKENIGD